jgi:mevalonate kinase
VSCGTGRATGKAILAGEHFVVYGVPAIAVPLPGVALEAELTAPGVGPPPAGHVAACLDILHGRWGGPAPRDISAAIRSTIPIGAGLGSSAALSVALARAWAALTGRTLDTAELREASLACERLAHGSPSGIDTEVGVTGRVVRFARGGPVRTLTAAPGLGLVLVDTATASSTRDMVEGVARRRAAEPAAFEALCARAAAVVADAERALGTGDLAGLGAALTANQELLAAIGVSTPRLEEAIAAACRAGAVAAKLTGKGGGGTVLAVCDAAATAAVARRLQRDGWSVVAAGGLGPAGTETERSGT